MDWLINLFTTTDSVAHIALLYSVVIAIGVYLGKIKIGGISLGVNTGTKTRLSTPRRHTRTALTSL